MNAKPIDPGSHEVLATVCEMGAAEVDAAVRGAQAAYEQGANCWRDKPVDEKISVIMKLVELCERDRDVLLACEIFDGGKVSELAEGDFDQIRACAEYFCEVAKRIPLGDSSALEVGPGVQGYSFREPWGVVAGIILGIIRCTDIWFIFRITRRELCADRPAKTHRYPPSVSSPRRRVPPGSSMYCLAEVNSRVSLLQSIPGSIISFTGSPGVGQHILRTCDRHGTRMKREMGGNGSAIVLADADPLK